MAVEIVDVYTRLCEAMLSADVKVLDSLMADGAVLTHMTGYEQSKAEWLEHIQSGKMVYHGIDTQAVEQEGEDSFIARSYTEATIWGAHGTWPLQLSGRCERVGDTWVLANIVASTWQ
ncbi:nuclear transport factor 2 family protein [Corynebacterium lowii]|uniref:nuclear transport factor 2 family protein n=1 Tax=Corynebacterium lowii TaxID=1544413 RepID=UPI0012E213A3|nr:nuclear transport factor 2 family protein [Corynebacterium lowii]MDP9852519.1 hypothetical protein [Corynebacterium lowii]